MNISDLNTLFPFTETQGMNWVGPEVCVRVYEWGRGPVQAMHQALLSVLACRLHWLCLHTAPRIHVGENDNPFRRTGAETRGQRNRGLLLAARSRYAPLHSHTDQVRSLLPSDSGRRHLGCVTA